MKKIELIWEELEYDSSYNDGYLFRRYSSDVLPDVFIVLIKPHNHRCISVNIEKNSVVNIDDFSKLKDIQVNIIENSAFGASKTLILRLLNSKHNDLFSALCNDLISEISSENEHQKLIKAFLNRLRQWEALFDKVSIGLSHEQQRGLYGELLFVKKYLEISKNNFSVIQAWTGPDKQIKDFQNAKCALEVKTSISNKHQRLHINSERQLDTRNLDTLFLYHISLELRQNAGETLNELVSSIYSYLDGDFASSSRFRVKLSEAGYFEHHRDLYKNIGYFIREDSFYRVEKGFPRIEEADVPNGVGDVKYSIILSQCKDFLVSEDEVFQNLNFL